MAAFLNRIKLHTSGASRSTLVRIVALIELRFPRSIWSAYPPTFAGASSRELNLVQAAAAEEASRLGELLDRETRVIGWYVASVYSACVPLVICGPRCPALFRTKGPFGAVQVSFPSAYHCATVAR